MKITYTFLRVWLFPLYCIDTDNFSHILKILIENNTCGEPPMIYSQRGIIINLWLILCLHFLNIKTQMNISKKKALFLTTQ